MRSDKPAPNRREDELHRRKGGDDDADEKSVRAEVPAETGTSGTTMPKPMRSMKTVRKMTRRDGFFISGGRRFANASPESSDGQWRVKGVTGTARLK